MTTAYPFIMLEGSPRLRGKAYGKQAADRIKNSLALYRELFQAYAGMSWEESKKKATAFEPAVQAYLPDAVEEMAGIAEGAGVTYADILALNCRSELMFALPDGCTSLIIPPSVSTDGKPYIAQTWDWLEPARASTVILEIHQPPLPTILTVSEAGMIGGKGVNSAGIGCGLNALGIGRGQIGTPLHIMYRGIMNSVKISDAIDAVAKTVRAGSGNFVVGSADGFVLHLEYTPDNFDVLMGEQGAIAHTNHFLSPLFTKDDRLKADITCTFPRLHRAKMLSTEGKLDRSRVWDILADHGNFPDSICSHEDPIDAQWSRLCTIYATFIDPSARSLWVTKGNPCERQWHLYQLRPGS